MTIDTMQSSERILKRRSTLRPALILAMVVRGWAWVLQQSEKSSTRMALSELTDAQLEDIGVTRAEARREACQSFWR